LSPKFTFCALPSPSGSTKTFDFLTSPAIGLFKGTFFPLYVASEIASLIFFLVEPDSVSGLDGGVGTLPVNSLDPAAILFSLSNLFLLARSETD
jgi:hypothetical protein